MVFNIYLSVARGLFRAFSFCRVDFVRNKLVFPNCGNSVKRRKNLYRHIDFYI